MNSRKVSRAFYFLARNSTVGGRVLCDSQLQQLAVYRTSYDILKGYFGKQEVSGLKMGLLRIYIYQYVLKGFWIKFEPCGSKMGLLGNNNVLKGFWGRKRAFGSKIGLLGKIDVLKGLLGRKGRLGRKWSF